MQGVRQKPQNANSCAQKTQTEVTDSEVLQAAKHKIALFVFSVSSPGDLKYIPMLFASGHNLAIL